MFNRGPVARPPIKVARDMGAGDDGSVCGRRDGLPTSFWRASVCSPRRTVLELADSRALVRCDAVGGVSKGIMYAHRPGQC